MTPVLVDLLNASLACQYGLGGKQVPFAQGPGLRKPVVHGPRFSHFREKTEVDCRKGRTVTLSGRKYE
jgi:hypothetical protein